MESSVFLEFVQPGDRLRLRRDRVTNVKRREWTFFSKTKKKNKTMLLLLYKGRPLVVGVDDIDWESLADQKAGV